MKPKVVHQEAMTISFQARQALEQADYSTAFDLYIKAAELESKVAEFYFDKPELEPTRSVIIRSAAFLNIKAGLVENARKFIFFGLLHTKDELIKIQLNNALELAISLGNMTANEASKEFNYINLLRQRSVHYVLEPSTLAFGHSVSLEMIKDFSEGYLKSLKAFANSKFKKLLEIREDVEEAFEKEIDKLINPLVTSSSYGSFKFSIANDFLYHPGEKREILELKANVVAKYHNEIFINPLTDENINIIKRNFNEDEINEIFRPLTRIKAKRTPYKVGYYDTEEFDKKFADSIVNKQRQKLLTIKPIPQVEIGELENSITHLRSSEGKVRKKTIFRQQLKTMEYDIKTNLIEPSEKPALILNEEIILTINFNSNIGFTISYDDFRIEYTDIEYEKTLKGFYDTFYQKARKLANTEEKSEDEQSDWNIVSKLMGNPGTLKE